MERSMVRILFTAKKETLFYIITYQERFLLPLGLFTVSGTMLI